MQCAQLLQNCTNAPSMLDHVLPLLQLTTKTMLPCPKNSSTKSLLPIRREQCDQIGRFLKVLVNKFAYEHSSKRLVTFGPF